MARVLVHAHRLLLLVLAASLLLCCLIQNSDAASLPLRRSGRDGPSELHYDGRIIKYGEGDDPCEPLSESVCGKTEGCVWCKAQAIPSSCFKKEDAARLPPGVFQCDL